MRREPAGHFNIYNIIYDIYMCVCVCVFFIWERINCGAIFHFIYLTIPFGGEKIWTHIIHLESARKKLIANDTQLNQISITVEAEVMIMQIYANI